MTENELGGWHHRLGGYEFELALGVGDGQGSLACGSPQGHKESDTTERLHFHFPSGGQSIGASASVLPMSMQDDFLQNLLV